MQQPVVSNGQFTCLFDAKLFSELDGKAQLTVMISIPETGHPTCLGEVTWPDATRSDFAATRTAGPPTSENVDDNKSDEAKEPDAAKRLDDAKKTNEPKKREEPKEQGEAKKPEEPKRPEDKPKKPEELKEPDEPKTARKESDPPNKPDDNRKPGEPKEQGESKKLEDPKKDPEGGTPTKAPKVERETPKDGEKSKTKEKPPQKDLPASFAVNYPMGPFGRKSKPEQPKLVLFKNATIWTSGPAGTIDNGAVLVADGKIVAVGSNLAATSDALVVDASGKHISPGIIDCHSHMATDGGVNEMGQAITAEVRIGDFIDGNDIDIYRQLAGGVTAANVLHGSANPIGGQNQVIKLRWGSLPEELKFAEAPAGIKFALGENVKQSNMPAQAALRYPQSRMGVEQIIRDEFSAARDYIKSWNDWNRSHIGMQPRRDLELDAVAEVLEKKRWIHCHSYRQDEILAFLRVTDGFGVQIGTLQHILEGYKVADEMKKREVMASSFSDWWAYKFEVIDAIPYNGALLHHAGVVVSFNSDDRELARHLNHEAAKAVKYGGVPAVEALKFVTLNPARQLRVDQFVGSLESGKHADLVIWSGPPLSAMSRCEQTWIDGRRYFSLDEDRQLREDAKRMKATIVQKILATGDAMRSPEDNDGQQQDLWPREDEVCHPHFAF